MGKKPSGSWFTLVKRAFSPNKPTKTQDQDATDPKTLQKRDRRRWLFRKSSVNVVIQEQAAGGSSNDDVFRRPSDLLDGEEEKEKCAVLMAAVSTVKAAEAAAKTAHEVVRLATCGSSPIKYRFAAILIQTSFRGYLARRALRALKGIVMLQAVIRGQNVRKQATVTLRCMQALLRVQSRVHDQRTRLSHDGSRKSIVSENTTFGDSKYLRDVRERKSMSRDGSYIPDDWSERPHTREEFDAILHKRKMTNRNPSTMDEKELEETVNWLDRWIEAKQWENQRTIRASFDRRDSIKTVEIDSSRPSSRSGTGVYRPPNQMASHYIPNSPSRRSSYSPSTGQHALTPSPIKTRLPQIRSASPRCSKEERSYYLNTNIQSLRSTPRVTGSMCRYSTCANDATVPNYMAATESARAKVRAQSTPRQRPSTPEKERVGSVKKRLAFAYPDPCDNRSDVNYNYNVDCCDYGHCSNLRSPSFKSVQVSHVGMGQQWYYADSTNGDELSPCSTTHLRRWLG